MGIHLVFEEYLNKSKRDSGRSTRAREGLHFQGLVLIIIMKNIGETSKKALGLLHGFVIYVNYIIFNHLYL